MTLLYTLTIISLVLMAGAICAAIYYATESRHTRHLIRKILER